MLFLLFVRGDCSSAGGILVWGHAFAQFESHVKRTFR